MGYRTVAAGQDDEGKRIDAVLRRLLPDVPLSRIYRALRNGEIRMSGRKMKPADRVHAGVVIELNLAIASASAQPAKAIQTPGLVKAMILRETTSLLVLNKPRGMPVQGGGHLKSSSLDALVRAYLEPRLPSSLSFRPGPLHRLDRNTTGVIFFSTSLDGAHRFLYLLRSGACRKYYLALLAGQLHAAEVWRDELVRISATRKTEVKRMNPHAEIPRGPDLEPGADKPRSAETHVLPLLGTSGSQHLTLALCRISTGRTHQIRAQAAAHGFPLAGDRKYGSAILSRYFLHSLRFDLPVYDPVLGLDTVTAPLAEEDRAELAALFPPGTLVDALSPARIEQTIRQLE